MREPPVCDVFPKVAVVAVVVCADDALFKRRYPLSGERQPVDPVVGDPVRQDKDKI